MISKPAVVALGGVGVVLLVATSALALSNWSHGHVVDAWINVGCIVVQGAFVALQVFLYGKAA